MIDNKTHNPYDLTTYKEKPLKIIQDGAKKDLITISYNFGFEITGSNLEKMLLLSTGYIGGKDETNYFILDENDITKIIEKLIRIREAIYKANECKKELESLHDHLEKDLAAGYIESITIEYKKTSLPPYYDPLLYKAFIIRPNYKKDIDIPNDVNTAFNFLEVLRMDINEKKFDEVMNHIRHYYDIPIHFVGYDYDDEIKKRKKEAMKELDDASKKGHIGYTDEEKKKYNKMIKDLNIPINVLSGKKV